VPTEWNVPFRPAIFSEFYSASFQQRQCSTRIVSLCRTLEGRIENFMPICSLTFSSRSSLHSRIGSRAISLLESFNITDRISDCYYPFYAGVAWKIEPFQLCAAKLIQGFSSGLSNGNPNVGIYCLMQANYMYTFCGKNLRWVVSNFLDVQIFPSLSQKFLFHHTKRSLLVEIDYYLNFLKSYKNEIAKNYFLSNRETVSMLIDKGLETGIEVKASYGDLENPSNKQREMFFFHQAIRCFWLGYVERFKHVAKKCLEMFGHLLQFNTSQIKFYHGKKRNSSILVYVI